MIDAAEIKESLRKCRLRLQAEVKTHYLSHGIKRRILIRDNFTCQYCGSVTGKTYVCEHIVPVAMGGLAQDHNIVVACASCNIRKGRRIAVPLNLMAIAKDFPDYISHVTNSASWSYDAGYKSKT